MIIAVDFDGTLCEHQFPEIGEPNLALISILMNKRKQGDKLILWTCRHGIKLEEAIEWCRNCGLEFDAINDDLPEIKETFKGKSEKIFADIYIDDRNILIKDFINENRTPSC